MFCGENEISIQRVWKKQSFYRTAGLLSLLCYLLFGLNYKSDASHAMAVDLTYVCVGGNEYEFTLTFYRDCRGITAPLSPQLHIESATCGQHAHINLTRIGPGVEVSAVCSGQLMNTACNGGTIPGVQKYTYKGRYTLPASCTDWTFSYSECCRNNMITNLAVKNNIYVEATLNNRIAGCNSSPTYTTLPVPYICKGQPYSYNHGVLDAEGDSLVYSLINPLQGPGNFVPYSPGYSPAYPIITTSGTVLFDNQTGQMDLTPDGTLSQVCVVAIQVKEYRNGALIGTTMRDMQVVVSNCTNNVPSLSGSGQINNHSGGMLIGKNLIEVCLGEPITFDIDASDADGDNISVLTNITTAIPGATLNTVVTGSTATGNFSWTPGIAEEGVHTFTVTVKDDACQISGQQTYSFTINVISGTSAGNDKFYCPSGSPVVLRATGGTVFNWTMVDGSPAATLSCTNCQSPTAAPAVTSTYVVTSNFGGTCGNKDTVTVFVVQDFTLTMSADIRMCDYNEGAVISAIPGPDPVNTYTFSWTPANTLDNPFVASPVAQPLITTKYAATVTSQQGCRKTDSVTVITKNLIDLTILPGDSVEVCDTVALDVIMEPIGTIFNEHFDHEIDSTNWSSISGGSLNNTCGTYLEDSYYLNGTGTRALSTKDLDLTTGGTISFFVKAGFCNQCVCDKPENDEQDENMYVEYSIDGGANWIVFYMLNADYFNTLNAFQYIILNIPDAAKSNATRFRWTQLNHLNNLDVWVLDEISIKEGLGTYTYSWTPASTLNDPTIKNPNAFPDTTTTYVVEVTDTETGCIFRDSIKVIFKEQFEVISHQTIRICAVDTTFQIQVAVPPGTFTYQWSPGTEVSDSTIADPTITPMATQLYTVTIAEGTSHCYRRADILVEVAPAFTADAIADTSVCSTDAVPLGVTVNPAGTHYQYIWTPATGLSDPTIADPFASPMIDTTYFVYVRDTTGCLEYDSVHVTVYPDFTFTTSQEATICPGETQVPIHALATPGTDFTYEWSPGPGITDPSLPDQIADPVVTTTYHVSVHKDNGCWKRDSVIVEIYSGSLNLTVSADTTINEEDPAHLSGYGAESYIWINNDNGKTIDSTQRINPRPRKQTTYMVIGYDDCFRDTTYVTVDVNPMEFFIPNLFTPNGDGQNDNFRITNFGSRWNLEVYNRWGDLIYKKDQYVNEWDGRNESDGVYYYHITDTRIEKVYNGWVQIVR